MTWVRFPAPEGCNQPEVFYRAVSWDSGFPKYVIRIHDPHAPQFEPRVFVDMLSVDHRAGSGGPWPASLVPEIMYALQERVAGHAMPVAPSVFKDGTVGAEGVVLDDLQRRVGDALDQDEVLGAYSRGTGSPVLIEFEQREWDLTEYWNAVQYHPENLTESEQALRTTWRSWWDEAEITMAILAAAWVER